LARMRSARICWGLGGVDIGGSQEAVLADGVTAASVVVNFVDSQLSSTILNCHKVSSVSGLVQSHHDINVF
jgi:hypothetical protein